jgi:hypothetical protein
MRWELDDGGRAMAGYRGLAGDCATRAAAIVSGRPYQEIYDRIVELGQHERLSSRRKARSHPRTGVHMPAMRRLMAELGFAWVPQMGIGTGCTVHLADGEVPSDRPVVCRLSKHYAAVVDGILRDTCDCSRDGTRCVYGWWEPVPRKED